MQGVGISKGIQCKIWAKLSMELNSVISKLDQCRPGQQLHPLPLLNYKLQNVLSWGRAEGNAKGVILNKGFVYDVMEVKSVIEIEFKVTN